MDRPIERKTWTLRRVLLATLVAASVLMVVVVFTRGYRGKRLRVERDRLRIAEVVAGPFQEYISVTGEVVPIRTVYLDAVEGGRVEEVYAEEGAYVDAGARLLKLANTNLLLDIMYREAELFQQSNNLRNTRLSLEQNRLSMRRQLLGIDYEIRKRTRDFEARSRLAERGLVAANELAEAGDEYEYSSRLRQLTEEAQQQETQYRENQIRQLETSLERMTANLEVARRNLDDLVIRAPVSGQLTSLEAEIGQSKSRGQRLGQIDVLDGFKVWARVDEHYVTRLDRGRPATFTYDEREYGLVADRISPEVRDGRCEVDLLFEGAEPEGIRRGQTLRLRLLLGELAEAVLLPRGGFIQDTGGRWVYAVDESGAAATRRPIRLGLGNPRHLQVLEGLAPGDRVVVSSYGSFADADQLLIEE